MDKIIDIYDDLHHNYGGPKIINILYQDVEIISEKTVGNYMRELGIRVQYVKPYTVTTKVALIYSVALRIGEVCHLNNDYVTNSRKVIKVILFVDPSVFMNQLIVIRNVMVIYLTLLLAETNVI